VKKDSASYAHSWLKEKKNEGKRKADNENKAGGRKWRSEGRRKYFAVIEQKKKKAKKRKEKAEWHENLLK